MRMFFNGAPLSAQELSPLQRAVVISLFTWRRAESTDIWDGEAFGWWGDTVPRVPDDRIGSKLYQLLRRKITADILPEAQEMCEQALRWLVDDGLAESVAATCERTDTGELTVTVSITIGQDTDVLKFTELT